MQKSDLLKQLLIPFVKTIPSSRCHLLNTFQTPLSRCFVKREDELGFGVSGFKLRKYTSLLAYLLSYHYKEAVLIGSAYSNHILSMTQLLIEHNIKPTLFLLGPPASKWQGNLLLTSLLVQKTDMHWITRQAWPEVTQLATAYAQTSSVKTLVIPEGALLPSALPGALTLALDILENEQQLQQEFQHVFIDAGSGLMAIATLFAFSWLAKKTTLHILLLADTKPLFLQKIAQWQPVFEQLISAQLSASALHQQYQLYSPSHAAAFGSVTTTVLQTIKHLAQTEGFFTDPIYSAKLFYEAKRIMQQASLDGNSLIIHSGGALSLMGFQEQLQKLI